MAENSPWMVIRRAARRTLWEIRNAAGHLSDPTSESPSQNATFFSK